MRKTLPFVVFAVILFALGGCYSNKQPDYVNSIAATIDTIAFSTSGASAVYFYADTATHNPQMITIYGKTSLYTPGTATQPSIKMIVPIAEGTYYITKSGSNASAVVVTSATGSGGSNAVSGTIVVTRYADSKIQGNFFFTCADGTVVKDGRFIGHVGFN